MKHRHYLSIPLVGLLLTVAGCSVAKYIPEGETFYTGMGKVKIENAPDIEEMRLAKGDVTRVLSYKPNGSLAGSSRARLPFTYPFWIHRNLAGATDPLGRWVYKNFGSEPILLSTVNPPLRAQVGKQVLEEYGFFGSTVVPHITYDKDSVTAKVGYDITMSEPLRLDSIDYRVHIVTPDSLDLQDPSTRLLHKGDVLSVWRLESERQRIASALRDRGYYYFQPNDIHYDADTLAVPGKAQLRVDLSDKTTQDALRIWSVGRVTYDLYDRHRSALTDSTLYDGILFRYHNQPPVKLRFLASRIRLEGGQVYNERYQTATITSLSELETFAYTNVSYTPRHAADSLSLLDVSMVSMEDKPYAAELEATYRLKSNNQTGPGLALSINKRNVFHGGETLSMRLQGNYEWQTGYRKSNRESAAWDINSYLFLLSTDLKFPRLLIPGLYYRPFTYPAYSKLGLTAALLSRSGFYRQMQFAYDMEYRFEPFRGVRHTVRPLSVSYNHLVRRTEAFDEALAANPGLGLSFRNQFIPQASYLFGFETRDPLSRHTFSLEAYVSEAGNLLSLCYTKGTPRPYRLAGASFAQFVKGTLELRYAYQISSAISLATRAYGGAIYSYGNQTVAPYTEQFYSGGANSLRGFNVRTLGPGAYSPLTPSPLSFLDRTGDLRLEANMELRAKVVGDLEVATFVDAGNIWLLREDPSKPDATISTRHFLQDVALSTGLGLRYDLSMLVVRLDLGVALHRPDRSGGQYFNTLGDKHNLPLALHLAVGYPF